MLRDQPPYDDERHLRPVPDDGPERGGTGVPPADIPAEKALLSALLQQPRHAPQLADELTGNDFYQPRNETIWNAIQTATQDGTTDRTLVAERVAQTITHNGNARHAPYLLDLATSDGDPLYLPAYIQTIRDHARLRAVTQIATQLGQAAASGDLDKTDDILARAVDIISDAAVRWGPSDTTTIPDGIRDLSWLLTRDWPTVEPPVYCRREDGHALFYRACVNGIFGDPESAKTWLAQMACVEAMNAGELAVVLDVDHNGERLTMSRFLLLGAKPEQLADRNLFIYAEPIDGADLRASIRWLVDRKPAVVVIDSIGEIVPMMGGKSVDNDDLSDVLRSTAQPFATVGACVITIDHLPKSNDARISGYAIGGTAKKRAIRGSYIHAEVVGEMKPKPGAVGKVALRIEKDTMGELGRTVPTKYLGHFIIDSTDPRRTTMRITREFLGITKEGVFRPTKLMESISRYIEDNPGCTGRTIMDSVPGGTKPKNVALQRLLEETYVSSQPGARRSTNHFSVKPFRESDDELF